MEKTESFRKILQLKKNDRKKDIHIHRERCSNEIFAMFDKIESEIQIVIENLSEDSDMEYIAVEPVLDNKEISHQFLIPEATVRIEGEVLVIDEPPAKKLKKKVAELKWKRTFKFVKAKKCTLKANVL